jgi:hypothetical protein
MDAVEPAAPIEEEIDYSEADYVDEQWEYLQKHKQEGITWEEYCRKRGINI